MKKGDLVKLNPNDPEILRVLEWGDNYEKAFMASRPTTFEEKEEWRGQKQKDIAEAREAGEDTFHIAFNDAGESRLAPRSISIPLLLDGIYVVQRARCRVELGWGRAASGMTKLLDTKTGEIAYVKRDMLEVISESR
tara:strand:- start:3097 stop:3507 length:411 start_codon:yes stop_codon:yes gene_type:complete